MLCPLLIISQSEILIQIVDINSYIKWQTVPIQISWLLQKPTDLDLHCLQEVYPDSAGQGYLSYLKVSSMSKENPSEKISNWLLSHQLQTCATECKADLGMWRTVGYPGTRTVSTEMRQSSAK